MPSPPPTRLRGPTLVAAPLMLIGLAGAALAIATALWGVWSAESLGVAFVATLAGALTVAVAAAVAARGCFVEVADDEVRDVVGWRARRRVPLRSVVEARVLAGPWRRFELECDDGVFVVLIGASPVQFPSTLLPGAREKDLADLELLRSGARSAG